MENGGLSKKAASFAQIGLFIAGAVGIQVLSRIMHHLLPSHIIDCDHTHDEDEGDAELADCPDDEEAQHPDLGKVNSTDASLAPLRRYATTGHTGKPFENGELSPQAEMSMPMGKPQWTAILSSSKPSCDETGTCYGFSDPCGINCFRSVQARSDGPPVRPNMSRSLSTSEVTPRKVNERTALLSTVDEEENRFTHSHTPNYQASSSTTTLQQTEHSEHEHHAPTISHHHHVPKNAFLSIGLQTSLAITLHKIPEGFITYATNHANPHLGVTIFMSLFIHNITEGFALALPLYLALQSRPKAMLWSALLGGISQPLGAGIAALWFHIAGSTDMAPGEAVYGGMFAVVAGIMANVGVQLMGEAWELGHNRELCIMFAFIGMGILGLSSALTA